MKISSIHRYAALLGLSLVLGAAGARAEEAAAIKDERQVVVDPSVTAVNISKGYFYVTPLGFMPSKVVVGQPEIVGVDVVGAQPFPHVHLIGLSGGSTNLVVFDQDDKIRVSMRLTVSDEVDPRSTPAAEAEEAPSASAEQAATGEQGSVFSIRVYRALAAEEVNCTDQGCNTPQPVKGSGKD